MYLCKLCADQYLILKAIQTAGGVSYLVGGFVRDVVMDLPCGDADIEVHGLSLDQLAAILKQAGPVSLVGKQFGVLKLPHQSVDWSLPRTDSSGRKPQVSIDPSLSIEEALRRRDVTMNAMAINLNTIIMRYTREELSSATRADTIEIIDPYKGQDAIKQKKLCFIDAERFVEDPLRFFRVMHFIGRFNMQPDSHLNNLCKKMDLCDAETRKPIAQERVHEELKKLFLKAQRPSRGFRWLHALGRLEELFPELHALIGVPQKLIYHPEGDVFEHTMQALDAAAALSPTLFDSNEEQSDQARLLIMYATLCHDLGKPTTTNKMLQCHGHPEAGVAPTRTLMKRLTGSHDFYTPVIKLVVHHMKPKIFIAQGAKSGAYKRLASQLAPDTSLRQLALVSLADARGRNGESSEPLIGQDEFFYTFIEKARMIATLDSPEQPVLNGRDLIDHVQPGPRLGQLLKQAYALQLEEDIRDPEVLKQRILGLVTSKRGSKLD